ncbi:MAG: alpha/beta fold hydrolase, partial [Phycisphaerales bacterium]|nr:alpha/beta fold hydrolase [Phycisphaerales bacterium]
LLASIRESVDLDSGWLTDEANVMLRRLQNELEQQPYEIATRILENADQSPASDVASIVMNVAQPPEDGLIFFTEDACHQAPAELVAPPKRAVILVHGLGRTAFIWNDLIPELRDEGYFIGSFHYSTDGPITAAADLLATELREARKAGIERVDVIAHSMGGLVVRELLTHEAYYDGDGAASEKYPVMDRLIMLGTPNHGSSLARLTDFGSKLARDLNIETPQAVGIDVLAGRAGVDLLPDSEFLKSLNRRPLPTHTRISIVAAQWSPFSGSQLGEFAHRAAEHLKTDEAASEWNQWLNRGLQRWSSSTAQKLVDGLGDGLVTIDSARLDGVEDFTLVTANHMGMLFRLMPSRQRPPAIPIILDRLSKDTARD